MRTRIVILVALVLLGARGSTPCQIDLVARWNRFAGDANRYVRGLDQGVVDLKLRGHLDSEWQAVRRCECW